ncbi:MAG: hypothetical protein ACKVOL_09770 [Novosphingobium sp.]
MTRRTAGQIVRLVALTGAAGGVIAGFSAAQTAPPTARYEMRAGTTAGMMAGMAGMKGGGMGAAMSMAFGGKGSGPQHELWLELGSSRAPAGQPPKADHFMPAVAKLGASVALKTPVRSNTPVGPVEPPEKRDFQRPKGRILIFWGCGEHAPAGQPIVIDFSKIAAGQMPPGLWSSAVPMERSVSPGSSKTYGSWPNDDGKSVKTDSSLLGAHRVSGNYSPDINFTLTHDFMGALRPTSFAQPSGATLLRWNPLPDATGYHASLIGAKSAGGQMGDMVWWSSSATREFGGGLSDWLSPKTVARLVTSRTVLAPATTTCMIPAEVKAAAPEFQMATLYAYGPEEDFVFPPRPANPKTLWKPEWTAQIRHRSMNGFLLGMPGMDDEANNGAGKRNGDKQSPCPPKPKKRGLGGLGGLGGLIGGALGGAAGGASGGGDGC